MSDPTRMNDLSAAGAYGAINDREQARAQEQLESAWSMPKLREFAKLGDNWDGRNSKRLSGAALATAGNMTPVPLANGGIQIEMHAGGIDLEVEIAPDGQVTAVFWSRA